MPNIRVIKCRSCDENVKPGGQHRCSSRSFTAPRNPTSDGGDFLLSYVVASATDSELLGFAVGGNAPGAILGGGFSESSYGGGGDSYGGSSSDSYGGGGDSGGGGD